MQESNRVIQNRFRIYYGPEDATPTTADSGRARPDAVTVPLGDVFPLLADALDSDRAWLQDFEADEVTISNDLYEMLMAYRYFHRSSG